MEHINPLLNQIHRRRHNRDAEKYEFFAKLQGAELSIERIGLDEDSDSDEQSKVDTEKYLAITRQALEAKEKEVSCGK